jgi:hypothetical protein
VGQVIDAHEANEISFRYGDKTAVGLHRRESSMRKLLVFIVALATFSLIASAASAGKVKIAGAHSSSEIRSTCDSAGGTFSEGGGLYGCAKVCGNQDVCLVNCWVSAQAKSMPASLSSTVSRDQGTAAPS